MTSTPIFDALAEELDVTWRSSSEAHEQDGRPDADDVDRPLSGNLG